VVVVLLLLLPAAVAGAVLPDGLLLLGTGLRNPLKALGAAFAASSLP
jgi:hypothetical protein